MNSDKKEKKIKYPSFNNLSDDEKKATNELVNEYVGYLDTARTVHTTVDATVELAKKEGYIFFEKGMTKEDIADAPGVIFVDRNHLNVAVVRLGEKSVDKGVNVLGAHTDFCSLINKAHPLMNKEDGIYLDTRPYGGFYNHQWTDRQLKVIGETVLDIKNDDGIIVGHKTVNWELSGTIPEATIHNPGGPREKKDYKSMFPTEDLDVFTGYTSKEDFLAEISHQTGHEMTEKEFNNAKTEFTVVPDEPTQIMGDFVVGYGSDDRSCVYTATKALINAEKSPFTSMMLAVAREEIGSTGIGGAQARFYENVLKDVAKIQGVDSLDIDDVNTKSMMYSADVKVAYNPQNKSVQDKKEAPKFGEGGVIVYGYLRGSYVTSNDMSYFTDILDNSNIPYQVTTQPTINGKGGGGGTIAKFYQQKEILTADLGIPIGNMHGTNSRIYKGDVYAVEQAFETLVERDFTVDYWG